MATNCATEEKTFRAFTAAQSTNYATHRGAYHPRVYQVLLDRYASTGGHFDTLLDVGCGPGTAIRALAPKFQHAIGLDPSEGMITAARGLGGETASGEALRFDISSAEDLGAGLEPKVQEESVDLIVAGTAAHWFDMSRFWPRAAKVLRPGGSVAFWCGGRIIVGPETPNRDGVQAAIEELWEDVSEFVVRGNVLARHLYEGLEMPWMLEEPVEEFDRDSLFRREWGIGEGVEPGVEFYATQRPNAQFSNLDRLVLVMGTCSPVVKWREANPEKVGTKDDVVTVMRRKIETLLGQQGGEKAANDMQGWVTAVMIILRKK